MATLGDLVSTSNWDSVCESFTVREEEPTNRRILRNVLHRLQQASAKPSNYTIVIQVDAEDEHLVVLGRDSTAIANAESDDLRWIYYCEWDEWLGMEVEEDTLNTFPKSEIVAACLFEMSCAADSPKRLRQAKSRTIQAIDDAPLIFISHASEDKLHLVQPLAEQLQSLGLRVWYDSFDLFPGDRLEVTIANAISSSSCGVIVLSPFFIRKHWPVHELGKLATERDLRLILILHNVTPADISLLGPPITDLAGLSTHDHTVEQLALVIQESIGVETEERASRSNIEHRNRTNAIAFCNLAFSRSRPSQAVSIYAAESCLFHMSDRNCGNEEFIKDLGHLEGSLGRARQFRNTIVEHGLVAVHYKQAESRWGDYNQIGVDIFSFDDDGKIVEYWSISSAV